MQTNSSFEILKAQQDVIERCKGLIKATKMDIYKPLHVYYKINEDYIQNVRGAVLGQVEVSNTNPLRSLAIGSGLEEAEAGRESNFTILTNDSDGKQCYYGIDQVTVKIQTPSGEDLENEVNFVPKDVLAWDDSHWIPGWKTVKDYKHGTYRVTYTPTCHGHLKVMILVNDQSLPGGAWSVQVRPHQYKFLTSFGVHGKAHGKFKEPCDVAINKKTANIAVADPGNNRVQLFDTSASYLMEFGKKGPATKKLSHPTSVAFTNTGNLIIIASSTMYCFNENGQFLNSIPNKYLYNPFQLTITCDGHMVVSDRGDKSIKVLSPDGTELVQSFSASDCHDFPWVGVCHQDRFFVSYPSAHVVKAFSKEGKFLYDIGGDRLLSKPLGLATDGFNNLVVCDADNSDLKVFSLDGEFLIAFRGNYLECPCSVTLSNRKLLVIVDSAKDCVVTFK